MAGARRKTGSGKSGLLDILPVGQHVLERTAVRLGQDGGLRLRLTAGLPAAGRRILGREAAALLTGRLPQALDRVLTRLDRPQLARHVQTVEDQLALRQQLSAHGLVAFVAEGSILPRHSGADDRPLDGAIPLEVPPALACELEAPHAGPLRGLGVRAGVTLIAGGGYHGKSTLLAALAQGVYDHIPGDGRERCVSVPGAVSIRAEDGRAVRGGDLRPFITALPLGRRTVDERPDGFAIRPAALTGGVADAAGDHRMAMAFAIAALAASGPTTITGHAAVDVSYPGFFDALAAIREPARPA